MVLPRALSTLPSPDSKTIALSLMLTSIFSSLLVSGIGELLQAALHCKGALIPSTYPDASLILSLAPHLPLRLPEDRQIDDVVERHFAASLDGFLGLVDHEPQSLLTNIDIVVVNLDDAVVRRRRNLAVELQPFR